MHILPDDILDPRYDAAGDPALVWTIVGIVVGVAVITAVVIVLLMKKKKKRGGK